MRYLINERYMIIDSVLTFNQLLGKNQLYLRIKYNNNKVSSLLNVSGKNYNNFLEF